MASYRLTRRAEADLAAIARYTINTFGVEQADIYRRGLGEIFRFLAQYPRAARKRIEVNPPVRVHPYKAHLVVYLIDENDDVLILRVPHSREDWQRNSDS